MWPFKDDPDAIRALPDGWGALDPVYLTDRTINALATCMDDDDDTQPASGSSAGDPTEDKS